MTPEERSASNRRAAYAMHAKHDPRRTTAKARAAFRAKFETEAAFRAHMQGMALARQAAIRHG